MIKTIDGIDVSVSTRQVSKIPLLEKLVEISGYSSESVKIQAYAYIFSFVQDFLTLEEPDDASIIRHQEFFLDFVLERRHQEFKIQKNECICYFFGRYDHRGRVKPNDPEPKKRQPGLRGSVRYVSGDSMPFKAYDVIRPDIFEKKFEKLGEYITDINHMHVMMLLIELANTADYLMMEKLLDETCQVISFFIFDLSKRQRDVLLSNSSERAFDALSLHARRKIDAILKPTENIPHFPDKFYSRETRLGKIVDFGVCERLLVHALDKPKLTKLVLRDAVRHRRLDFLIYAKSKIDYFDVDLIHLACRMGDFSIMKFLYESCDMRGRALSCASCLEGKNIECFKYILEKNFNYSRYNACRLCIEEDNLDFLKHAESVGCSLDLDSVSVAVENNAIQCLKYLTGNFIIGSSDAAALTSNAVFYGSEECLRYLLEVCMFPINTLLAKKTAIENKRDKILKYLDMRYGLNFDNRDLFLSISCKSEQCMNHIIASKTPGLDLGNYFFASTAIGNQFVPFLRLCSNLDVFDANKSFNERLYRSFHHLCSRGIFPSDETIIHNLRYERDNDCRKYLESMFKGGYRPSRDVLKFLIVSGKTEILKLSNLSLMNICKIAAECGSVKSLKYIKETMGKDLSKINKKKLLEVAKPNTVWYIRSQF